MQQNNLIHLHNIFTSASQATPIHKHSNVGTIHERRNGINDTHHPHNNLTAASQSAPNASTKPHDPQVILQRRQQQPARHHDNLPSKTYYQIMHRSGD
mmetsp:Transcript_3138/g.4725  ORF Transcript_3138/g.4725 Transcript_3138/m.4725 type:complete len:98 (-) Transcript_3138:102-395(-)